LTFGCSPLYSTEYSEEYKDVYVSGGKLWSALYRFAAAATVLTLLSLHTVVYAQNVSVFAAVSLNEALDEALVLFERPANIRVVPSYAASSALARQIQSGAPADVFISADTEWMDYLAERKLIDVSHTQ
jgi:molybdate transport system substrate-binding protein